MKEEVKINMSRWKWKDNSCYKHWMTWTHLYQVWQNIKRRVNDVTNKRYQNYWWRWITYDKRWNKFEDFYKDMWPTYQEWLTIDRRNNMLNYCKSNCRWINSKWQANNRTTNILITIEWETKTLTQWCEELNLPYSKIVQRIKTLKWSNERALELI